MSITDEQLQEIEALRAKECLTKRATVPEMEEILYKAIPVLDHGFVRVVDYMGDDSSVVQAARVSYGKGTKKVSQDQGLINYLMRHWHSTPFEMCEIKLHVKLPIFVARHWIRHRTANVNEYSARYSIMDKEFYLPAPENLAAQAQDNRQGRDTALAGEEAERVFKLLKDDALRAYDHYEEMLNQNIDGETLDENKTGLARELARMNLPVNFYTQWYWKTDLHNFMHFLRLRADNHAQYEIRAYAEALIDVLKRWVPLTHAAFMDYRYGGVNLSAKAMQVVKRLINGDVPTREDSGLSLREWNELNDLLGLNSEKSQKAA